MEQTKSKTTPKDFFFWVAVMATLYISAISLLTLLFEYIDIFSQSQLQTFQDPFSGAIRFAIASLIIIFPMYIYLTRVLNQEVRLHPEKKEITVRKWLIFFTIFIAGATIIIDLIVLINAFLGGKELTVGFILKVFSVFIIIGGVFLYYLNDVRGVWERREKISKAIGAGVSLMVLAVIVYGFLIIGSPQTQRLLRFDEEKISDLLNIQWQITSFYQQKERIPENLDELGDPLTGFVLPNDPQTDNPYGYEVVDNLTFSLCANFNKESSDYEKDVKELIRTESLVRYKEGQGSVYWIHSSGTVCFERTIDPDKFPQLKFQ